MRAKKIANQRSINESDVIIPTRRSKAKRTGVTALKILQFMAFAIFLAIAKYLLTP